MAHVKIAVFALAAASQVASAQAPAARKVGADALMIDLIGRSPASTAAAGGAAGRRGGQGAPVTDTTSILVGRDEVKRFVLRAHQLQPAQLQACGARNQPVATLGSAANQWFLRLTCRRDGAGGPATWGLLYTGGPDGGVARTTTVGSTTEVDRWLQQLASLVQGKRPIRLKG